MKGEEFRAAYKAAVSAKHAQRQVRPWKKKTAWDKPYAGIRKR